MCQLRIAEREKKGFEQALSYLETAKELAPRSARTWAAYATVCAVYAQNTDDPVKKKEMENLAKSAAEKAEKLAESQKKEAKEEPGKPSEEETEKSETEKPAFSISDDNIPSIIPGAK